MKKYVLLFAIFLALVLCLGTLAACKGDQPKETETAGAGTTGSESDTVPGEENTGSSHKHAFGDWKVTGEATCTEDGEEERSCACGEKETRKINAKGHAYEDTVTPPTKTEKGYTPHTCSACGDSYQDSFTDPTGSIGLTFSFGTDGRTATVTGIGTCQDSDVVIPSTYQGKAVTGIGLWAFVRCKNITSITIPDSVTNIDYEAFTECTSITSITIPKSVTRIGDGAFNNTGYYNNESNWENGVLYIGKCLIDAKASISGSYTVKAGTKLIASSVFENCTGLTDITIPDSVTSIGESAF